MGFSEFSEGYQRVSAVSSPRFSVAGDVPASDQRPDHSHLKPLQPQMHADARRWGFLNSPKDISVYLRLSAVSSPRFSVA
jgi:hypothetical protein